MHEHRFTECGQANMAVQTLPWSKGAHKGRQAGSKNPTCANPVSGMHAAVRGCIRKTQGLYECYCGVKGLASKGQENIDPEGERVDGHLQI